MKNTVIHVWTNNCSNIKYDSKDTSSYWGIGDLIRGTIKLFQLQRYLKFNLIVRTVDVGSASQMILRVSLKVTRLGFTTSQ
jgi:hypothetical protein